MAKKIPKETAPVQRGVFIYLGPSIRGVIQHAQIFSGTAEEIRRRTGDAIARYPEIETLLVPASEAGAVRAALKQPGSGYATAYKLMQRRVD